MRRPGRTDAGSATIYVLAGCLLVGLLALVPIITGAAALARHRAAVAADAAALAAARTADADVSAAPRASDVLVARGCKRAADVARADDAAVISCSAIPCGRGAESLQVDVRVAFGWGGIRLPSGDGVDVLARAGDASCLPKSLPRDGAGRSLSTDGARQQGSGR